MSSKIIVLLSYKMISGIADGVVVAQDLADSDTGKNPLEQKGRAYGFQGIIVICSRDHFAGNVGRDCDQVKINTGLDFYKPVHGEYLKLSGVQRVSDDKGRHSALHFQTYLTVEMIELADASFCDQMPVAADHTAVVGDNRFFIDGTVLFKFQTGCLKLHKIPP